MATKDEVARALITGVISGADTVPSGWRPSGAPPQATKTSRGILGSSPAQYFDEGMLPRDQTVYKTPTARQAIEMVAPAAQPNGVGYGYGYTKPTAMQLIPGILPETPSGLQTTSVAGALAGSPAFTNWPGWAASPGMAWEDATTAGVAPAGDPWAGLRAGSQALAGPQVQGLVTGQPVAPAPVPVENLYARLKQQQQLQSAGAKQALEKGRSGYTVSKPKSGVLGSNALMPTRTISGAVRNSYGD